nr:hypothetical protein [Pseudomonas lundensis]
MVKGVTLVTPVTPVFEGGLGVGAAIEELSNWVEQIGSTEVAQNIRGALDTLDGNEGFITLALASLAAEGRTKK